MDRYSKTVALLKVLFPLGALGLLSVLFFFADAVDYEARIPFADDEIDEMTASQRISDPRYTAVTSEGHKVSFVAETAFPALIQSGQTTQPRAVGILGTVDFSDGSAAQVSADLARLRDTDDRLDLSSNVVITSSQGYDLHTEHLISAIDRIDAEAPEFVSGTSPMGDIEAGAMKIYAQTGDGGVLMRFTKGVKIVYLPDPTERP